MAENLPVRVTVEDSKQDSIEVNEAYLEAIDVDEFDDVLVEGDEGYLDPDLYEDLSRLELPIDHTGSDFQPVPTIDLSSVTKTRRVLATGEVVYDVKFDVIDVGATKYEVIWAKQ